MYAFLKTKCFVNPLQCLSYATFKKDSLCVIADYLRMSSKQTANFRFNWNKCKKDDFTLISQYWLVPGTDKSVMYIRILAYLTIELK